MTRLALLAAFLPSMAFAEDPARVYIPMDAVTENGTWVEMRETTEVGAVAEVEFRNRAINNGSHNGVYPLAWNGLTIIILFRWNVGPNGSDQVTIEPPMGHSCWPGCEITMPEGSSGAILIYPAMS